MLVSIIIPTYNSLSKLRQALASLEIIDFPRADFEVVVVDDGSTDQTPVFLADYGSGTPLLFRYFRQPNRGPAAARNLAIRHARGDYLLSIDADCFVDRDILNRYLRHFPCPNLAGVGGDVLPEKTNVVSRYLDYIGVWRPGAIAGEIRYLVTANAFFCKKALLEVGGFDEDFRFPGGEEPEMCHRLRRKGYFFRYENEAKVVHAHRTNLKSFIHMFKMHGIGCRICASKWEDFAISTRTMRGNLLGKTLPAFTMRAGSQVGVISAVFFAGLEYVRLLSYYRGYHMKLSLPGENPTAP